MRKAISLFLAFMLFWGISTISYADFDLSGMSINRVSALLTQLRDAGSLNLTIDKRKNYYSLAD